jgi:predicted dehydrogenase
VVTPENAAPGLPRRPRVGFVGVGWIGRHRLDALAQADVAEIAAIADADETRARECAATHPGSRHAGSLADLLDDDLDGVVIATPNALHLEQCLAALSRGVAVFCQKPLARNAHESLRIVQAAAAAGRPLGVDLSYRRTRAMDHVRRLVQDGVIGDVFAADLVFHNAYGPDKAWFFDRRLSGGGCLLDLGIHLVDLALWTLGFPAVSEATSRLYASGRPLAPGDAAVEDFALAQLQLETGATVRLTCSWKVPAGCDAVIEATFLGTRGAARLRNVNGSFYDFVAEHLVGTRRDTLCAPPDAWGGRMLVAWAEQLAAGAGFDPASWEHVEVARVMDRIYGA